MKQDNAKILLLILLLTCLITFLQAEIRALWVLPWNSNTPEKIDQFISDAVKAKQTDVLYEVRYRSDALYLPNRLEDTFPNPEPRSHILNGSTFDPLDYILQEGHKNDLRVHAWFVTFNATPTEGKLLRSNYIYQQHPDWITHSKYGRQSSASYQLGYFIDPGIPEVQDYLLDVIGDLVSGYPDLDGLHLDYIRYPDAKLGYHPVSVQRYNASVNDAPLPWNQWRVRQVSSFVERTRTLTKAINPRLLLSAAVIADYNEAVNSHAQDWYQWLEAGYVDYVYPMAYLQKADNFNRRISAIKLLGHEDKIVMGLRAWNDNGSSLAPSPNSSKYDIYDLLSKIMVVREKNFAGLCLFSYDALLKDNAFSLLIPLAFAEDSASKNTSFSTSSLNTDISKPAISVVRDKALYQMQIQVPQEGKWNLKVLNSASEKVMERSSYYLKGVNQDFWTGELQDGTLVPPGRYIISVNRENDVWHYEIPIDLPGLEN